MLIGSIKLPVNPLEEVQISWKVKKGLFSRRLRREVSRRAAEMKGFGSSASPLLKNWDRRLLIHSILRKKLKERVSRRGAEAQRRRALDH